MAYRKDVTLSIGFLQARVDVDTMKATGSDDGLTGLCANGHDPAKPSYDPQCPVCGTVKRDSLVKGKEVGKDSYVVFTTAEVTALKAEEEQYKGVLALKPYDAVEVEQATVPAGTTYYLTRNPKDQYYGLIRRVIENHPEWAFVGIYTVSQRSAMYRVKILNGCLVAEQLLRPEDVKPAPQIDAPVNEELLTTAEQVVGAFVTPFDPATFRNTYRDALAAAVESREGSLVADAAAAIPAAKAADPDASLLAQMNMFLAGTKTPPADPAPAKPARTRKKVEA